MYSTYVYNRRSATIHVRSRGKAERPSEKYGLLGNAQEEEAIVA